MYKLKMSYNNEITEENDEEDSDEFDMPDGVEYVSMTVLNRQTNGPHPDCDLEIDAVVTPTEDQDQEELYDELPPHPLDLGILNFVDNNPYSVFYNRMYNMIDPRVISYDQDEDEDNKIREIYLDELVMPTPCLSCFRFECNC